MTVSPGHQCAQPGCEREARKPENKASLCETCISGLEGSDGCKEPESGDENLRCDAEETPRTPADARALFADRLEAAGLDTRRFIDVHYGEKRSTDHTQHRPNSSALHGNYGVYGGAGAGEDTGWILVDIDVDDYDGERAPDWIPETLAITSPHTDVASGGHFYVALPTGAEDALEEAFGTANPNPPWGEIRVHNQYCVGPGSQLDGCSKDWCSDCAEGDGGYYRIKHDEPIAQLDTDDFIDALQEDMPNPVDGSKRGPSGGFEDLDLDDYEPDATGGDETTDDIRDLFAALDRIDARRVAADTIVHAWNPEATTSGNYRAFAPIWGPNANGTANIVDDRIWQDTGGTGYGGPVVMALIDAGEMDHRRASPRRASGAAWWRGIEHLRELGFPIPEYEQKPDEADPVALLPPAVRGLSSGSWDWRHAGKVQEDLTPEDAWDRTQQTIANAYKKADSVLVDALPTLGKTTGAVRAAAQTDRPVTYLAPRREIMGDVAEKAREAGLEVYTLPAFTRHCNTANGDHGEEIQETVLEWYRRGATPKDIHKNAEHELGHPLPCQEHEGKECQYTSQWRFDPDDYDVLIGHYNHAHKEKVTTGRAVVFDEFPGDTYETRLTDILEASVTAFLQSKRSIPYQDYADLLELRGDTERRARAVKWFEDHDPEDDPTLVFNTQRAHAKAPLAVYTLLAGPGPGEDLGNGWERCHLPDDGVGLFDRENNEVRLLKHPDLTYTRSVVALDGTPTKRLWELTLGTRLKHRQLLTDEERQEHPLTRWTNYQQDRSGPHPSEPAGVRSREPGPYYPGTPAPLAGSREGG